MARKRDKQPPKTKKYFRSTKSGAGMTAAGVAKYRRDNPGSKLKTAVTGKVKKGSKAAKRIIITKNDINKMFLNISIFFWLVLA